MLTGIIKAVISAFSTYTAIPTPKVCWDGASARLALGFFPLTGVVIGAALYGWHTLCEVLGFGGVLFAAVAAALPVLISGGIHLDGFCDTVDALSSRGDRTRMLQILKDPNAGAFAVIFCCVYLLISFGLFSQAQSDITVIVFGYTLSRSLSALNAVTLPSARQGSGMLGNYTKNAQKGAVITLSAVFGILSCAGMFWRDFYGGAAALILVSAVTIWYRQMSRRKFGGATGDTAGFYLQLTELMILIGAVIGQCH